MEDYQRILSYLYRYDNGQKKECKGFIKAEQKPEELKLTIQIEDDRLMEDMQFQLCFYQSQWNCIDRLEIHRQREELTRLYPRAALPPDFDIAQQAGVLLYYQDALYYGSVWIGEEIPLVEMVEDGESMQETAPEVLSEPETEQKPEVETEPKAEPEPEAESEPKADCEPEGELIPQSVLNPNQKVESESEVESTASHTPDYLERIRSEAEPATRIFNQAFYEGYQIIDRQLPRLGAEAERLLSNQFLRDGYKKHRHLLAGKVRCGGEDRYCVGVPGVYDNREKYMAQLYQFPIFLALTENRVKTGGPGYWLHLLPRE